MIYGIGIDIIETERIAQLLERKEASFIQRIFTEQERSQIPLNDRRKVEYLAGRFAAKEAFSKALGTGIGASLHWHEIEILTDLQGKPYIKYTNRISEGELSYHLSISHSNRYAVAQVIIES